MYFLLCFIVLLKQLRRLYTSGFIFQVPPVYNYSTCCTNRVLTHLVYQVRVYAFSVLTTRLRVYYTYKALTNYNFLSPGWKIAISSLSTSALAALKI